MFWPTVRAVNTGLALTETLSRASFCPKRQALHTVRFSAIERWVSGRSVDALVRMGVNDPLQMLPSPKSGRREFWKRPFIQRYWSNEKMRFQSFFMLMTNQPSFFASS